MRTLVIDTSSTNLTIALFEGAKLSAFDHRAVGRGHAEHLIHAIAALPDGGMAERVLVGCGPGSFTGIRIGIAAARALAFAWQAELKGFDSLALLAVQAHRFAGSDDLAVVVDGGHGEWFVWHGPLTARSLTPEEAAVATAAAHVAGVRANELVTRRGFGLAVAAEVDARDAMKLPPGAILDAATPLYGRPPDAKIAAS